ncbi:hypothetical protein HQ571_02400 [Candidatus Kuenenbacteria bacterium]|nr:hypothetical protein [Candidatus Kuenenbacteria bacterium]
MKSPLHKILIFDDERDLDTMSQAMSWGIFFQHCFRITLDVNYMMNEVVAKPQKSDILIIVPKGLTVQQVEDYCLSEYSVDGLQKSKGSYSEYLQELRRNCMSEIHITRKRCYVCTFDFCGERQRVTELSRSNESNTYAFWTPNRREPGLLEEEKKGFDLRADGMNYIEQLLLGLFLWWKDKKLLNGRRRSICVGTKTVDGKIPTIGYKTISGNRVRFMDIDYLHELPSPEELCRLVRPVFGVVKQRGDNDQTKTN